MPSSTNPRDKKPTARAGCSFAEGEAMEMTVMDPANPSTFDDDEQPLLPKSGNEQNGKVADPKSNPKAADKQTSTKDQTGPKDSDSTKRLSDAFTSKYLGGANRAGAWQNKDL